MIRMWLMAVLTGADATRLGVLLASTDALFQYRFDTCSMLIVAAVGGVLARQVQNALPRLEQNLRFAGVAALLAGGVWAFSQCDPAKPFELACVALFAVVTGEVALIAAAAVLVPPMLLRDRRIERLRRLQEQRQWDEGRKFRDAEEQRTKERHDLQIAIEKEEAERSKPTPPPSRSEGFVAARKRYEETIRILESAGLNNVELEAGRERAKQKFLREIDEAM